MSTAGKQRGADGVPPLRGWDRLAEICGQFQSARQLDVRLGSLPGQEMTDVVDRA